MIFIPFTTLFSFIPKSTPFPLEQTEKERDCPLKHTTVIESLDGDSKGVFQGQHLPSLSINYVANWERFRKITHHNRNRWTKKLLWSGLQRHRICHINEMTPLPVLELRFHCNPDHNKFLSLSNIQLWYVNVICYLSTFLFIAT